MRRVRIKMDFSQKAKAVDRVNGRRCGHCPKFQRRCNWCPILACVRMASNAVCEYGYRLISSQQTIACRERRQARENGVRSAPKKGGANGHPKA